MIRAGRHFHIKGALKKTLLGFSALDNIVLLYSRPAFDKSVDMCSCRLEYDTHAVCPHHFPSVAFPLFAPWHLYQMDESDKGKKKNNTGTCPSGVPSSGSDPCVLASCHYTEDAEFSFFRVYGGGGLIMN